MLRQALQIGLMSIAAVAAAQTAQVPADVLGTDIAARYAFESRREHGGDGGFALPVDLDADALELKFDQPAGLMAVRYRMAFNQVTEGWSWQPGADPATTDYYRYKYLPLGRRAMETAAPQVEVDGFGRRREIRTVLREHYYLAFDNLYDFYPRSGDDDAGFFVQFPVSPEAGHALAAPGRVRLLAVASWAPPYHRESFTLLRAVPDTPVDISMKNRYFIGRLEQVWFYDADNGRVLARLPARHR